MPTMKRGYSGPLYNPWYDWAKRKYSQLAELLGRRDGYFGSDEDRWTRALQAKLGLVQDGIFGDRTAAAAGYAWPGESKPPVVEQRRPIWHYTAPGSGAPGNVGPAYQLGERCKREHNVNHQWIGYPIGGYLGFMGGDPKYSYLEVIDMLDRELERLLWLNPDVQRAMAAREHDRDAKVDVELWFEGYSQSADGIRRSVARLFGEGGPFERIRDRINGLILFGDPSTPGTGISGLTFPAWLERLCHEINYPNDFYAVATDKIRRTMFGIIVQAEMELPFFVHVLRLAARIIPDWLTFLPLGGLLGGLLGGGGGMFGSLAQMSVGAMTGLSGNPALGSFMGMAGTDRDKAVDDQLYALLRPTGVLASLPEMIGLVAALPGLQAHGGYEFDQAKMDEAFGHVARFRR